MTTPPPVSFSIVIATYAAAGTLRRCLDSIWEQDHPAVEVLVADGASPDGTVAILAADADRLAHWVSEPDDGITDAWNKLVPRASGEWLYFLGADDVLSSPDVLSRVAAAVSGLEPTVRVVYGSVRVVGEDGTVVRTLGAPWTEARDAFRHGNSIPHQGAFHHRSLFESHGLFDPRYRILADYEFLLRELLDHEAVFIPDLVVADMGAGGLSDDMDNPALVRELRRAWYEHGLTTTPPSRDLAVWRTRVRDAIKRVAGPEREAQVTATYRRVLRRPPR